MRFRRIALFSIFCQAALVPLVARDQISPPEATTTAQSAAPDFGPNVLIFDPSTPDVQSRVDEIFARQERSEFGPERYAIFFKPGRYELDVQVGFYTQVAGLGQSPDEVEINGAVRSTAGWRRGNATCNFWRSAENLAITPTKDRTNVWAVSQGASFRGIHVKGNLHLSAGGWSSGGFMADSQVDGIVDAGTQQQWFCRNSKFGKWDGGQWNMVFLGTINPPSGKRPEAPYTVVAETPLAREKPFLSIDEGGRYFVSVPNLSTAGTRGPTWSKGKRPARQMPLDQFYLARPDKDDARSMNEALARGLNLLLTPGIYHLDDSIRVSRAETVVLGMGFATLIPDRALPAISVADVDGVTVAGLILEAGTTSAATLLQIGEPGTTKSHAKNPTFLHDIFCRVGGPSLGTADCMVTVNSSDVVGDNLWLWRADHGRDVGWDRNKNKTGLIVNGNNVTMYGLFVEHCQEYQTVWNGNGGRVYFYQSEMPYDPPSRADWGHGSASGYASYKVGDKVTTHEAWGLGVYCVFHHAPAVANNAIETPTVPGVKMHHMVTIRLGGNQPGAGISHVINGRGDPVITNQKAFVEQ